MSKRVLWVVEEEFRGRWIPILYWIAQTKKEAEEQRREIREDMRVDGTKVVPMQVTRYIPADSGGRRERDE